MPFRASFDCLWCGRAWQTRGSDDLEGWASLCSDCLGKADGNGFLAFRLRAGLAERARASRVEGPTPSESGQGIGGGAGFPGESGRGIGEVGLGPGAGAGPRRATPGPRRATDAEAQAWSVGAALESDDWYLRRGRFARGPVRDLAWTMELDTVTGWLDRLPIQGDIVELAAGTGWWSPLLAGKGELTLSDLSTDALDSARRRLVAHGLRAHLHERDAWAPAEREVDTLVLGCWLSLMSDDRLGDFLDLARRWLRPGGLLVVIDRLGDPETDAVDATVAEEGWARRRLVDGSEVLVPLAARGPDALADALRLAGFEAVAASATPRFFVMGSARRADA